MNSATFLSQVSEPTHFSPAQYALAYGLIALTALAVVLLHRAAARRPPVRRAQPTSREQQWQQAISAHETEYQRRCCVINDELIAGRMTHDEAHREWRRARDDFFDVLAANGYPQPGHRRST